MYVSFMAALERKTGKVKFFAIAGAVLPGSSTAEAARAYALMISPTPEGVEARAKFSHCLFVTDNVVRNQHDFPDEVAVNAEALRTKRYGEAKAKLEEVNEKLRSFTAQRDALRSEHEAARGAFVSAGGNVAEAPPAFHSHREHEALQAELVAAKEQLDQVVAEKAAADKEATEKAAALAKVAGSATGGDQTSTSGTPPASETAK